MIAPDSSIWEVHWNGQQRHFGYTTISAANGLCSAGRLADKMSDVPNALSTACSRRPITGRDLDATPRPGRDDCPECRSACRRHELARRLRDRGHQLRRRRPHATHRAGARSPRCRRALSLRAGAGSCGTTTGSRIDLAGSGVFVDYAAARASSSTGPPPIVPNSCLGASIKAARTLERCRSSTTRRPLITRARLDGWSSARAHILSRSTTAVSLGRRLAGRTRANRPTRSRGVHGPETTAADGLGPLRPGRIHSDGSGERRKQREQPRDEPAELRDAPAPWSKPRPMARRWHLRRSASWSRVSDGSAREEIPLCDHSGIARMRCDNGRNVRASAAPGDVHRWRRNRRCDARRAPDPSSRGLDAYRCGTVHHLVSLRAFARDPRPSSRRDGRVERVRFAWPRDAGSRCKRCICQQASSYPGPGGCRTIS